MSDERRGLPSASGLPRIVDCPGSWALEITLPPEAESEDATSGTLIHDSLAGAEVELDHSEEKTREMCAELADKLASEHGFIGDGIEVALSLEKRLWLNNDFGEPLFSEKHDCMYRRLSDYSALVCDYKTGRGEVAPAESNWQLRAQAVLVARVYGLRRVLVAIIQPWVSPQVTVCEYGPEDLQRSHALILSALRAAQEPNAPRRAGLSQCKFCRAKAVCPEARWQVMSAASARTEIMGPKQFGAFLEQCDLAEKIIKAARKTAKTMLEFNRDLIEGWTLEHGRVNRPIVDIKKVWLRAHALGISQDDFLGCAKVTKSELTAAVKAATGAKGAALESEMETLLKGCCAEVPCEPSLKKMKA